MGIKSSIKNYLQSFTGQGVDNKEASVKNLGKIIVPIQLERARHDIQMWREAIMEAEQGFVTNRFRVRMQRMFVDTVLNEHVEACIKKRKRAILLKEFTLGDNEKLTKLLKKTWFSNFLSYCIDSVIYGYTLISLGDIVNGDFPFLTFIRRENVSPDRMVVSTFVYSQQGINFIEPPHSDWHIYISTPTETGVSVCGNGLLYKIAKTEILLRNNTTYNADFNEMYGQPIRKGKTNKTDETERAEFFQSLVDMAHKGAILLDDGQDELELLEAAAAGTGWQGFENFEKRLEQKISKVILGHSDALDSTPGKLGSQQGGDSNPVAESLKDIETEDTVLCETIVNTELLPRLRAFGFDIPEGVNFAFLNNKEKMELRRKEDEDNQKVAAIALSMSQAGLKMDKAYFQERTNIPTTDAPLAPAKEIPPAIKNQLNEIYGGRAK